jgi:hypothetical protein
MVREFSDVLGQGMVASPEARGRVVHHNGLVRPGLVIAKRVFGETIELSGLDIPFDFSIPRRPVELHEPSTELRQFLWRQGCDRFFNFLDCVHNQSDWSR